MKVILIPDSFKDCLSSEEISAALARGLRKFDEHIEITNYIGSDGGEGFLEAVAFQKDVQRIYHDTLDPIGRPIEAAYLLDRSSSSAYIELAQASGLELLSPAERNPLFTSTVGTGMQILHAIGKGARHIYVGLGGSATNDGGIGMASVLGYQFRNHNGELILPIGDNLINLKSITGQFRHPDVEIVAISDVKNPLLGKEGATSTFSAQKGATPDAMIRLETGMENLERIVKQELKIDLANQQGAGAAGGSGFGLMTFFGAEMRSGIDFILDMTEIENTLQTDHIDLIITGEGRLDNQSFQGKLIDGVIRLAQPYHIPVMAICGQLDMTESEWRQFGLTYATRIAGTEVPVQESILNAKHYVEEIAGDLIKNLP